MMIMVLGLLVMASAAFHIRAEYQGPRWQVYLFKPLTMVFILAAAAGGQPIWPFYKYMIIIGLIFSLAGDVFLMLPRDFFLAGLGAFLTAHLFYIAAFVSQVDTLLGWIFLPLILYGAVTYYFISSFLGKLKLPVLLYLTVILVMAGLAWLWWTQTGQAKAFLASMGALLFVVSDTILAVNRFRGPFKPSSALILSTYFAAQWLIAGSI